MKIFAHTLIQMLAVCSGFCALPTFDEKLPPKVAEITRKQINHYLGTNDFKGIPLLDRTIDWNSFTNWPDQFSFKGRVYRLGLTDTSAGDYFVGIKSRTNLPPRLRFMALYGTSTNFPPPLGISSVWHANGFVSERIVSVEGKKVFGHLFFPSGQLYLFLREDAETTDYAKEYFDRSGRLVGTDTWSGVKQKCEWEGIVMDHERLLKKALDMYNESPKK